jgi:hypothetical protein
MRSGPNSLRMQQCSSETILEIVTVHFAFVSGIGALGARGSQKERVVTA